MSYEGYVQMWCPLGHYWTEDAYQESRESCCPECARGPLVRNQVDETNCESVGYIKPEIATMGARCGECGQTKTPHVYNIPTIKAGRAPGGVGL